MNASRARELLGIKHGEMSDIDMIKRKYRIKALIYHPDKNKSVDACNQFREIHEAYQLLSSSVDNRPTKTYVELLAEFLKSNDADSEFVNTILNRISQTCEDKTLKFLSTLDNKIVTNLYRLIVMYADVLHVSSDFLMEVGKLIKKDECIVLNPKLSDAMSDNLYKLTVNDKLYVIPLWHHELLYDNSGCDLHVICKPTLPNDTIIDEDNNIVVNLEYKLSDVFGIAQHELEIGGVLYKFNTDELRMREHNTIVIRNSGLSRINPSDIYDVSSRGDVILHIRIVE